MAVFPCSCPGSRSSECSSINDFLTNWPQKFDMKLQALCTAVWTIETAFLILSASVYSSASLDLSGLLVVWPIWSHFRRGADLKRMFSLGLTIHLCWRSSTSFSCSISSCKYRWFMLCIFVTIQFIIKLLIPLYSSVHNQILKWLFHILDKSFSSYVWS